MQGTTRSADERARILEAYECSGLSVKAFAERESIAPSTLYQWLGASKRSRPPAPMLRIARVVRRAAPKTPPSGAANVVIGVGTARIEVPPGFDRDTLGAILDLLAARVRQDAP